MSAEPVAIEPAGEPATIDFFDPGFAEDPYPFFSAARRRGDIEADPVEGWWVLDPALIAEVLRDHRFGNDFRQANDGLTKTVMESRGHFSLLTMDDPDHKRVRGLVAKAFTRRTVESIAGRIQEITDSLLDDAGDEFDVMTALASPLPIIVIAEILGIDPADRDDFGRWSRDGALLFDLFLPPEVLARVATSGEELRAYLAAVIEARRVEPRDDLISALVAARDDGDRLTTGEMIDVIALLLGAGNITTTDLIGNAVLALLSDPEQWHALTTDPSLAGAAVEEALRFNSPVLVTSRVTLADVEVGGCPFKKGEWVTLGLAAANRGERVASDPDRFDITRPPTHHLSFGGGAHFCLGAQLARVEATTALRTLATRFPDLALAEQDIAWRRALGFRGLDSLRVVANT
jgi:hypothetical protein